MGQDKGSLITKRKAVCGSKGKQNQIYLLLPTSRKRPATAWEEGPQHLQWLLQKTNTLTMNVLPLCSFLLAFIAEHIIRYGIAP